MRAHMGAPGSASVRIRNLRVDLDEFHLREINLDVAEGEYFVILGPTGAGKTVLLETIAGLYPPQEGNIWLDGTDVTHVAPERRGIGFVYQDYVLFPHLDVAANIGFGLELRRLGDSVVRQRLTAMAELLGIAPLLHRRPDTLSGGEQQRAALARAMVVEPRLLLLDEPLSALDPVTRGKLQRELARLHQELGITKIQVTHDFEEAVALGDRIAVMNEGRIVQVGSPGEIFRRPESEFVARFVGSGNILRGVVKIRDGSQVLCLDGVEIAVVTDVTGAVHASIRSEDIVLSKELLRSSARNCFRGRIVEVADRGALFYVTVRVPPDFVCAITRASLTEMELKEGTEVWIAFKASAVHVF